MPVSVLMATVDKFFTPDSIPDVDWYLGRKCGQHCITRRASTYILVARLLRRLRALLSHLC